MGRKGDGARVRVDASDVVGLVGAGLTGAGVWSLWGWAWAAIALGVPLLVVYLFAEARRARRMKEGG